MMAIDATMLDIHLNHLEDDASELPKFLFEAGTELANARRKTKEAKNALKVLEAELDRQVRADPEKYGLEKITEPGIKAVILDSDDYKVAQTAVLDAEHAEDLLDIMVKALGSKKDMIEVEARLHGQMYWSKPDLSGKQGSNRVHEMAEANKSTHTTPRYSPGDKKRK
jgi:chromosome segregation ATPase